MGFFFLRELYLFIYLFWLCWVFVSVRGLPLVAASGGHSSRCAGLTVAASLVAEHRLQTRRLSNCGSRVQLLRGMWDPPRPGLEPMSPALAGRFSTTAPPGKPLEPILILIRKDRIELSLSFSALWGYSEKMAIYKARRVSSPDTKDAPWSWTFQPPEVWKTNVCCLSHSFHSIFVIAAPQNWHQYGHRSQVDGLPSHPKCFLRSFLQ